MEYNIYKRIWSKKLSTVVHILNMRAFLMIQTYIIYPVAPTDSGNIKNLY